jgi:hypothetical protein
MVKAFDGVVFKKELLKVHGSVKTRFGYQLKKRYIVINHVFEFDTVIGKITHSVIRVNGLPSLRSMGIK